MYRLRLYQVQVQSTRVYSRGSTFLYYTCNNLIRGQVFIQFSTMKDKKHPNRRQQLDIFAVVVTFPSTIPRCNIQQPWVHVPYEHGWNLSILPGGQEVKYLQTDQQSKHVIYINQQSIVLNPTAIFHVKTFQPLVDVISTVVLLHRHLFSDPITTRPREQQSIESKTFIDIQHT